MVEQEKRLKRLRRLLELQTQPKRLHEWKMSDIQRQKIELVENKHKLISALNRLQSNGILLTDLIGKKLTAVSKRGAVVDREHNQQSLTLRGQQTKVRQIDREFKKAKATCRAQEAKQDLFEIIELALVTKNRDN